MKLIVFGATGGTGRELLAQGAAAGHDMTAFARRSFDPGAPPTTARSRAA